MAFTPYDLEMETTVEKTLEYLSKKELGKALVSSLRLNEDSLVKRVIESVNPADSKIIILLRFFLILVWYSYGSNQAFLSSIEML